MVGVIGFEPMSHAFDASENVEISAFFQHFSAGLALVSCPRLFYDTIRLIQGQRKLT
jgi:hypothetical protein